MAAPIAMIGAAGVGETEHPVDAAERVSLKALRQGVLR
jgi:hypothetical protein